MATPHEGVEGCGTQPPEAFVANPKTSEAVGEQVGCRVGVAAAGESCLLRDMVVDVVSLPMWLVGRVPRGLAHPPRGGIGERETLGVAWPTRAGLEVFIPEAGGWAGWCHWPKTAFPGVTQALVPLN